MEVAAGTGGGGTGGGGGGGGALVGSRGAGGRLHHLGIIIHF